MRTEATIVRLLPGLADDTITFTLHILSCPFVLQF